VCCQLMSRANPVIDLIAPFLDSTLAPQFLTENYFSAAVR
jgi:hypothetical protein